MCVTSETYFAPEAVTKTQGFPCIIGCPSLRSVAAAADQYERARRPTCAHARRSVSGVLRYWAFLDDRSSFGFCQDGKCDVVIADGGTQKIPIRVDRAIEKPHDNVFQRGGVGVRMGNREVEMMVRGMLQIQ